MKIEIRHLKYFIAVAEERHFGRAAVRLNISQPPLSQQIQILEQQVGALLFSRTHRSVNLTQAGEVFLQSCYQIVEQLEQAVDKAARVQRGELGELKLGFTSSIPFISKVARSLFQFRQSYPQVQLQLSEMSTRSQIDPLLEGRLHLGIMRNTLLPSTLKHQVLLREPSVVVFHQDHPLACSGRSSFRLHELVKLPWIIFSRRLGTTLHGKLLSMLNQLDLTPTISQEVEDAMTIVALVSAGAGISILPASYTRISVDDVCYRLLDEEEAYTEVWLVYHQQQMLPIQANRLIHLLMTAE